MIDCKLTPAWVLNKFREVHVYLKQIFLWRAVKFKYIEQSTDYIFYSSHEEVVGCKWN